MKTRVLIVYGTRPEGIKMAPLVKAFNGDKRYDTKVCNTGQHQEILDQVNIFFDIVPEYSLNVMSQGQSLNSLVHKIIMKMEEILNEFLPDIVFVHGDTTTAMASAIAAFNFGVKVAHVEAGLRTNDINTPFPEEANRQLISRLASFNFAPTQESLNNLINENIDRSKIFITGNTVIDALFFAKEKVPKSNKKNIILITAHRRENFGSGIQNIIKAVNHLSCKYKDYTFVWPVHPNPNVKKPVHERLGMLENVELVEPLDYPSFIDIMSSTKLILSDSGGIQEEAPSLGIPVLVLRESSERPEAVNAGTVILVGTNFDKIVSTANKLISDDDFYKTFKQLKNPYGDGTAAKKIKQIVDEHIWP